MTHAENTTHGTIGWNAFDFARDGYDTAQVHDPTASDIENATVYGRDDETIGSLNSLEVDSDGKITEAVIGVRGFLGMGAHSVLLPFGELTVLRETDGTDLRIHLDTTAEKLKAMAHHTA